MLTYADVCSGSGRVKEDVSIIPLPLSPKSVKTSWWGGAGAGGAGGAGGGMTPDPHVAMQQVPS
jgi:hypothetical protein